MDGGYNPSEKPLFIQQPSTMFQQTDQSKSRRRQTDAAIQLARANRWEDAVAVNRAIISLFPNDVDSYNRLGKALMELGRHGEAKKAYKKALTLDATNRIASKNLERLTRLAKAGVVQAETPQADPTLFIEEIGKSVVTPLVNPVVEALARLNAGDRVELMPHENALVVATPGGEHIGEVEAKLGLRLRKLMEGGNQYSAGVTSIKDGDCRIIIKETYQDPSLAGRPSFPSTVASESTRPYTKQGLVRHDGTAAEAADGADAGVASDGTKEAWEGEPERQEGDVRLYDAAAAEEKAGEDELEE